MTARPHSAAVYDGLRTAFRLLVQQLGGIELAVRVSRAAKSSISNWGVPHGEYFAPADIIADLETAAGEPLVTEALARAQGFELIKMDFGTPGEVSTRLHRLGADVATLFGDCATALQHGTPKPAERERLMTEMTRVIRDARDGLAALRALGEKPGAIGMSSRRAAGTIIRLRADWPPGSNARLLATQIRRAGSHGYTQGVPGQNGPVLRSGGRTRIVNSVLMKLLRLLHELGAASDHHLPTLMELADLLEIDGQHWHARLEAAFTELEGSGWIRQMGTETKPVRHRAVKLLPGGFVLRSDGAPLEWLA